MENRESISDIENPSPDDIEAQQTPPRCLEAIIPCLGRGIAAVAIIEVPYFFCSMKMNTVIHFAAVLVPVSTMLAPIFLSDHIHEIFAMSILTDALRSSTRLVIVESIAIGCTLPVLSDMFVDRITVPASRRVEAMSLSMWHRVFYLATFSVSSILYVSLSDRYFMAFLYIVLYRTKVGNCRSGRP